MALRYYSKEEFEAELISLWELVPTEHYTETTRGWRTKEGSLVLVPELSGGEGYPHFLLGSVAAQIKALK